MVWSDVHPQVTKSVQASPLIRFLSLSRKFGSEIQPVETHLTNCEYRGHIYRPLLLCTHDSKSGCRGNLDHFACEASGKYDEEIVINVF
jgi:hypothetical protein